MKLYSLYAQPEEKRIKFEEEEDNVDTNKSKEDEQTENEESTGTSSGNSSYELLGWSWMDFDDIIFPNWLWFFPMIVSH